MVVRYVCHISHNSSNELMLTNSLSVSLSNKCLTNETWIKLYKLSQRHPKTRLKTAVVQFQFSPGGETLPPCHYSVRKARLKSSSSLSWKAWWGHNLHLDSQSIFSLVRLFCQNFFFFFFVNSYCSQWDKKNVILNIWHFHVARLLLIQSA